MSIKARIPKWAFCLQQCQLNVLHNVLHHEVEPPLCRKTSGGVTEFHLTLQLVLLLVLRRRRWEFSGVQSILLCRRLWSDSQGQDTGGRGGGGGGGGESLWSSLMVCVCVCVCDLQAYLRRHYNSVWWGVKVLARVSSPSSWSLTSSSSSSLHPPLTVSVSATVSTL